MQVVLAGATGLVGSVLLEQLLNENSVQTVTTVGRRAAGVSHLKLREVLIPDFQKVEQITSQLQGDVFICCLGTTIRSAGSKANFFKVDHDSIVAFGRLAHRQGARVFIVISASGADARSAIFYNQVKGQTETDLRKLGLQSLIIFRPGLLEGHRQENRPGERMALALVPALRSVLPGAWTRRFVTPVSTLARAIVRATTQSNSTPSVGTVVVEASDIT